ncbi:MAG: outer membrane protein [Limisphaerales bacterium]|jgi:outer membrane protein
MNKLSTAPFLTAVLILALTFAGSVQAQSKLGHINFQELLAAMPEAAAASASMEQYSTELQNQYNNYLKELENKQAEYQANVASWSDVVRESNESDINRLVETIQQFEVNSQQAIGTKQNELMEPLIAKAQAALKAVGDELGLAYIIDSSTLIYIGNDAMDVMEKAKAKL